MSEETREGYNWQHCGYLAEAEAVRGVRGELRGYIGIVTRPDGREIRLSEVRLLHLNAVRDAKKRVQEEMALAREHPCALCRRERGSEVIVLRTQHIARLCPGCMETIAQNYRQLQEAA